ncbi:hypothetical protein DO70_3380 [Burkholderia pseudomallei]|nr:hypothetical protein DO70_3380 [Burkholderia pseudomallei]
MEAMSECMDGVAARRDDDDLVAAVLGRARGDRVGDRADFHRDRIFDVCVLEDADGLGEFAFRKIMLDLAELRERVEGFEAGGFERGLHVDEHDLGCTSLVIQKGGVPHGLQRTLRLTDGNQEFEHEKTCSVMRCR